MLARPLVAHLRLLAPERVMAGAAVGGRPGMVVTPAPDRPGAAILEEARDLQMVTRARRTAETVVTHLTRAMIRALTNSTRVARAVDPLDHQEMTTLATEVPTRHLTPKAGVTTSQKVIGMLVEPTCLNAKGTAL